MTKLKQVESILSIWLDGWEDYSSIPDTVSRAGKFRGIVEGIRLSGLFNHERAGLWMDRIERRELLLTSLRYLQRDSHVKANIINSFDFSTMETEPWVWVENLKVTSKPTGVFELLEERNRDMFFQYDYAVPESLAAYLPGQA